MSKKVWLLCIFICGCFNVSCALSQGQPVSTVPIEQSTLKMVPDFSYAVATQKPHIFVDQIGYRSSDKKVAFFYGNNIEETYEIREKSTDFVVYSGTLDKIKEESNKTLYKGIFTSFNSQGEYYIHHEQLGDSYDFGIVDTMYDVQYKKLENQLIKQKYKDVSNQAYLLSNYMFIAEVNKEKWINESYIRAKIQLLLNSMDPDTGAFYKEIHENSFVDSDTKESTEEMLAAGESQGTISLSTTAQMAGVLAQYVYHYKGKEDSAFINKCLQAAQKAYRYVENYRDNTDTDAWYFAATQLFRTTRQYKYRKAIAEYDTLRVQSRSSTEQGYTVLADFAYLSTLYGTDYKRCEDLLENYMEKAQNISIASSDESFYVLEGIASMSYREVLEDMLIMGVVNHILSGQEYAGVQKNYIHYLFGVNMEAKNYMDEEVLYYKENEEMNTANAAKMLVIYSNLCKEDKS